MSNLLAPANQELSDLIDSKFREFRDTISPEDFETG